MIRVGIAGIGFMGWIHWLAYRAVAGIEVAAVATRDPRKQRGDWTSIRGNFGPAGQQVDLSGVHVYSDWRDMVSHAELDLIDICLPPSLHGEAVMAASSAGRHVFCEKPLALSAAHCAELVAHVRACQRQLLVGHVLPFFAEYDYALNVLKAHTHGKPMGGHFRRIISRPDWIPDFFDRQKIGGPLIDLHVHDAHFIRLVFGMPRGVTSRGWCTGGTIKFCTTLFDFGEGRAVSATMGVIDQAGRPFTHGYELLLEGATLQFEYAALTSGDETMGLKVLGADGQVIRPDLPMRGPLAAFEAEVAEVRDAIQNNRPSELLAGDLARDAIAMCEAQHQAVLSGSYTPLESSR